MQIAEQGNKVGNVLGGRDLHKVQIACVLREPQWFSLTGM